MQLWRRGSLRRNPYYETAFRLARVPSEVTDPALVAEIISQTRQLMEADPAAHKVLGETVGASAVNQAELILLDPVKRSLEEIIEPAEPSGDPDTMSGLQREAAALLEPKPGPVRLTNPALFARWFGQVWAEARLGESVSDGALGVSELEIIAPWGPPGGR
jgi:hypothetical protein